MIALLLLLQTTPYTATVDKMTVKDLAVDAAFTTNLPDKAVVTLYARRAEYEYSYEFDRLTYQRPDVGQGAHFKTKADVAAGKAAGLRFNLSPAGLYAFELRFVPDDQTLGPKMHKIMGDQFGPLLLAEQSRTIGVDATVYEEIRLDGEKCRRTLNDCLEILDALDKIADGDEAEMAKRAKPHMERLAELAASIGERVDTTHVRATYRFVAQVLQVTTAAAQFIERMAKGKKDPSLLNAEVDETGKTKGPHDPNTPPPSPVDGQKGRPLSFAAIRDYITRAQVVRLRETLLWIVRFARLALDAKDADATFKAIDATLAKLEKAEPAFVDWAVLGSGAKLADLPAQARAWLAAPTPEARKEIDALLDAFEKKLSK